MYILVTGGAGFIGSNFIKHMFSVGNDSIINLDKLTYAGNLKNLEDIAQEKKYHFIEGDICDRKLLERIFQHYEIKEVVNFAAESHVDRSIEDPEIFARTNILGTQALLDTAKKYWKIDPQDLYSREFKPGVKFIQISTDEVYGTLGPEGFFTENTPLAPSSPYSASKAAADMLVGAYYTTYGLPVCITRCSNNYGPYQYPEKLIPLVIKNALLEKQLPIYGDGKQVRDWLYVEDHCRAIEAVLRRGRVGEVYNIGGNNEKENIQMVKMLLKSLDKGEELIAYVQDRLGHDTRYAIDNTKITTELGWQPQYSLEEGLEKAIEWYRTHKDWMEEG